MHNWTIQRRKINALIPHPRIPLLYCKCRFHQQFTVCPNFTLHPWYLYQSSISIGLFHFMWFNLIVILYSYFTFLEAKWFTFLSYLFIPYYLNLSLYEIEGEQKLCKFKNFKNVQDHYIIWLILMGRGNCLALILFGFATACNSLCVYLYCLIHYWHNFFAIICSYTI